MNEITNHDPLPQLAVQMYPLSGSGIITKELTSLYPSNTPEEVMADWRNQNRAEVLRYRRVYWMEPQGNKVVLRYKLNLHGKHDRVVGKTLNDLNAVKILIANAAAGAYLPGIRWELYGDRGCEEFLDMGRFDQWDLLFGIDADKLRWLRKQDISPRGNWDFDHMLWHKRCAICGSKISLNSYLYDIDSAICSKCGNRPFLAPSIHRMLDEMEEIGEPWFTDHASQHLVDWLSRVQARFDQVRLDKNDAQGARLLKVWAMTPMAKALQSGTAEQENVRGLIETNTDFEFGIYRACCEKAWKALSGAEAYKEEHRIAINLALEMTKLLNVRMLTTH